MLAGRKAECSDVFALPAPQPGSAPQSHQFYVGGFGWTRQGRACPTQAWQGGTRPLLGPPSCPCVSSRLWVRHPSLRAPV